MTEKNYIQTIWLNAGASLETNTDKLMSFQGSEFDPTKLEEMFSKQGKIANWTLVEKDGKTRISVELEGKYPTGATLDLASKEEAEVRTKEIQELIDKKERSWTAHMKF